MNSCPFDNLVETMPRLPDPLNRASRGETKVALIGATGFIGSQLLRSLRSNENVTLSILTRRSSTLLSEDRGRIIRGDLSNAKALKDLVSGADVVVNASSYVGRDEALAKKTNAEGTSALLDASREAGVPKFIQVSTAAVYGSGPHRALSDKAAKIAPESVSSRARALADEKVIAAGGLVIRPNLVYGPGDRWVIPGIIKMVETLKTTINDGAAKLSIIDVISLGQLISRLAVAPNKVEGVLHAAEPQPTTLADLLGAIEENVRPLFLKGSNSVTVATDLLSPHGFSSHQVNMVALDHYYDSSQIWVETGMQPRGLHLSDFGIREWYHQYLNHDSDQF